VALKILRALKARPCVADTPTAVDECVWTFVRANERLTVARRKTATELLLVVTADDDAPRSYAFADLPALQKFQIDMDAFLINTGWTFLEFSPDSRDRLGFPRIEEDERRREWTDGMPHIRKDVGDG
jgi:hypothetical protein